MLHAFYKRRFRSLLILCLAVAFTSLTAFCIHPAYAKTINPKVLRVIDGDTIEVEFLPTDKGGTRGVETVRFIGVDTPETVDPNKPVQPFGPEASAYTKSKLEGKTIRLEYEQNKRDQFGRLLAYVFLRGRNFNADLIKKGYARVFEKFPFKEKKHFQQLQNQAKKLGLGLWHSNAPKPPKTHKTPKTTKNPQNLQNLQNLQAPSPIPALITKLQSKPLPSGLPSSTSNHEPWFLLALLINGLGVAYWFFRKPPAL